MKKNFSRWLILAFQLFSFSAFVPAFSQVVNQNILMATTDGWTNYTAFMYTSNTLTYVANGTNALTYFGTNTGTANRWDWFTNGVLAATNTSPIGSWSTLAGAAYGKSQWLTNNYVNTAPGVLVLPGASDNTNAPGLAGSGGFLQLYIPVLVNSTNGVIYFPTNFAAANGLAGGGAATNLTPWTTDINALQHGLTNLAFINAGTAVGGVFPFRVDSSGNVTAASYGQSMLVTNTSSGEGVLISQQPGKTILNSSGTEFDVVIQNATNKLSDDLGNAVFVADVKAKTFTGNLSAGTNFNLNLAAPLQTNTPASNNITGFFWFTNNGVAHKIPFCD